MIETEQSVTIDVGIERVWDYVKDIKRWANLMPGLRECSIINENDSHWVLKVGAGGLVRTVNVNVHVSEWDGPENVTFSYDLAGDPVQGGGTYTARRLSPTQTEVVLHVQVIGSGQMARMWEAMGKPLLPQFAKAFAQQLKGEIEKAAVSAGPASASPATPGSSEPRVEALSLTDRIARLFRNLFGLSAKDTAIERR